MSHALARRSPASAARSDPIFGIARRRGNPPPLAASRPPANRRRLRRRSGMRRPPSRKDRLERLPPPEPRSADVLQARGVPVEPRARRRLSGLNRPRDGLDVAGLRIDVERGRIVPHHRHDGLGVRGRPAGAAVAAPGLVIHELARTGRSRPGRRAGYCGSLRRQIPLSRTAGCPPMARSLAFAVSPSPSNLRNAR